MKLKWPQINFSFWYVVYYKNVNIYNLPSFNIKMSLNTLAIKKNYNNVNIFK